METIVVKNVTTLPSGWTEVELEDGRKPSTKDANIIRAAKEAAASGEGIEALINERVNGNFTNHYLNQIGEVKESRGKTSGRATASAPKKSYGKSPEEQAQIQAQWAFGRATELLGSYAEFSLPLGDSDKKALVDTAKFLLEESSKLAKG